MDILFPEEARQNDLMGIIDSVLGKEKINVFISDFILKEDDEKKRSYISCNLKLKNKKTAIKGEGDGPVDALFNGLMEKLNKKYISLSHVKFDDFSMKVKFKESSQWNKTDAPVEIKLVLKNEKDRRMYFHAQSRSLIVSAIAAIRKALEFLINAELAVIQLRLDYDDAFRRNRTDLTSTYALQLGELVQINNYEKLFAQKF
jgi:hypothetical protein